MLKILLLCLLFLMISSGAFFGALWLDHTRETMLPVPTGPFAVGRAQYVWTDSAHLDPMAPQPGAKRQLFAWIWYPATPPQSPQATEDYLPSAWRRALDRQRGKLIGQFLTRDLSKVRTHSLRAAALSNQQHSYPVVFIRPGLALLTTDYTILAEDLASHGYVVVGFDAPYRSMVVVMPDGRAIPRAAQNDADLVSGLQQEQLAAKLVQTWSADMSFALDQLQRLNSSDPSCQFFQRLDLARVGAFGHSLGGATALQFCHDDSRCKAGIDVDGAPLGTVIAEGVRQPFLFLLSDHGHEPEAETGPVKAHICSIYNRLPGDGRWWMTIKGANHFGFSDSGATLMSPVFMRVLRMFGVLHLDGRRQTAITAHYVSTFFDVYLKQAPVSNLKSVSAYSEVERVFK